MVTAAVSYAEDGYNGAQRIILNALLDTNAVIVANAVFGSIIQAGSENAPSDIRPSHSLSPTGCLLQTRG